MMTERTIRVVANGLSRARRAAAPVPAAQPLVPSLAGQDGAQVEREERESQQILVRGPHKTRLFVEQGDTVKLTPC